MKKIGVLNYISIDYKRLLIFILVLAAVLGIHYIVKAPKINASDNTQTLDQYNFAEGSDVTMSVDINGQIKTNLGKRQYRIHRYKDKDELRILVLDKPGVNYYLITTSLEPGVNVPPVKSSDFLAIHGVGSKEIIQEKNRLLYTAYSVGEQATLTIVATWPKGTFKLSPLVAFQDWISLQPGSIWLLASGFLALLVADVCALIIIRRAKELRIKAKGVRPTPPSVLPPAFVGVLVNQRFGHNEIAATIFDLARRGYILIINRGSEYTFVPQKNDYSGLYPYEQMLLAEVLNRGQNMFTDLEGQKRLEKIYLGVYDLITRANLFIQNPREIHLRWRLFGIITSIAGILGAFISIKIFPDPPMVAVFWIGIFVAGLIIFDLGSGYTRYTLEGSITVSEWLSFAIYLRQKKPLEDEDYVDDRFVEYLPYAIALGIGDEWCKKYDGVQILIPNWYTSPTINITLRSFYEAVTSIIGNIGRTAAARLTPGVD